MWEAAVISAFHFGSLKYDRLTLLSGVIASPDSRMLMKSYGSG